MVEAPNYLGAGIEMPTQDFLESVSEETTDEKHELGTDEIALHPEGMPTGLFYAYPSVGETEMSKFLRNFYVPPRLDGYMNRPYCICSTTGRCTEVSSSSESLPGAFPHHFV